MYLSVIMLLNNKFGEFSREGNINGACYASVLSALSI